ncbi:DUF938 domain-containing protein [Shewanella sedimentimangrovi]|uniref:DUF938 domain-containing protein n=1 Tax=Shewanella sedimentimangrovi TaxID=2814293 RepID=A0ABX7QY13_9GAMM|nr:DUF938 domain-containing protein [Shewanella sedimentimangrovi]QSX35816.1 DUF938 domain-containing protein [Shewanella sedimentimangrovi]
MSQLPFSQACENNKAPILEVLRHSFASVTRVLEIGSGTGQHGVYFSAALPHINWQCSDMGNLAALNARLALEGRGRLSKALVLDVSGPWPALEVDGIFSANTLHIMDRASVECFFAGAGRVLGATGQLCIYGPFNYGGDYTSASNRDFDAWLKARDSVSGIRDIEWVLQLADAAGFALMQDHAMPANNRLLHLTKVSKDSQG